jgi:hypothetical protein
MKLAFPLYFHPKNGLAIVKPVGKKFTTYKEKVSVFWSVFVRNVDRY